MIKKKEEKASPKKSPSPKKSSKEESSPPPMETLLPEEQEKEYKDEYKIAARTGYTIGDIGTEDVFIGKDVFIFIRETYH